MIMISSKEIMIGDWVTAKCYPKPSNARVTLIDSIKDEVYVEAKQLYMLVAATATLDELEPIPLTPEILEKNGFYFGYTSNAEDLSTAIGASIGEPEHWCYDDGGESVEVLYPNDSDCGEVRVFNGDTLFSCFQFEGTIYLHELQHFLRLSKSEKEIQL